MIFKKRKLRFRFFFFGRALQKKKGDFCLCPFFGLFFFLRGFFFNPFFFCSASFCLFDILSILSDCWCCLGCRQGRANQKYTYQVPTLLQNIFIPQFGGKNFNFFVPCFCPLRRTFFCGESSLFYIERPFFGLFF